MNNTLGGLRILDTRTCPVSGLGWENKVLAPDGTIWWVCENTGEGVLK
jgi:hypothetical protein